MRGELVDHFVLLPCKINDIIYHKNGTRYQVTGFHFVASSKPGSHNGKWYMDLSVSKEDVTTVTRNNQRLYFQSGSASNRTCDFDQIGTKFFHTQEEAAAAKKRAMENEMATGKRDVDLYT